MNQHDPLTAKTLAKVTFLGLIMNVVIPVVCVVLAVYLTGETVSSGPGLSFDGMGDLPPMTYVFLCISIISLIITWYIKRRLPAGLITAGGETADQRFEKGTMKFSLIIFSINESYAVYGLILKFMGVEFEVMMIFVAMSCIGYQVFRPRPAYLEKIRDRIESMEIGGAS